MAGWGDGAWGGMHWGGERSGATYLAAGTTTLAAGTTTWTTETVVPFGSTLVWPPASTATLVMDNKNLIVYGTMRRHPTSYSVIHTLRFINVDESIFVGAPTPNNTNNMGSMIPNTTDIGLWVMEVGIQDDIGSPKVGWNRTGDDPTWQVGDDMRTTPFDPLDYTTYAVHTKGGPLKTVSPGNGQTYTQEAFNLTRNVITEGTSGHKAHALIMTPGVTQVIKYSRYNFMGPQKLLGDGKLHKIRGRWAGVHLHHLMDTVGTLIEGVVVTNGASHAFVSHHSNDTVWRDCIAYFNKNEGFWWDNESVLKPDASLPYTNQDYMLAPDQASDRVLWDHCMVGAQQIAPGESNLGSDAYMTAPSSGTMTDCVATGTRGTNAIAGTVWSESFGGVWDNVDCVMHNNEGFGVILWQNSDPAQLDRWISFRNAFGGEKHGAYSNNHRFNDSVAFQNAGSDADLNILANSSASVAPHYRNVTQDGWYGDTKVREHTLAPSTPGIIRNNHLGHVVIAEPMNSQQHGWWYWIENDCDEPEDFCNLAHPHTGDHIVTSIVIPNHYDSVGSIHKIQRLDGTAWQLTPVDPGSPNYPPAVQGVMPFTATVIPAFAFVVSTSSLTPSSVGTAYSQTLTYNMPALSAVAPVTWGLRAGSGPLPPGMSLSAAGVLAGTPTVAGSYPLTVQAVDLSMQRARKTLTLNVASSASLAVVTSTLPGGTVGDVYPNPQITASGGFPPYTFSLASGSLPPGLSLASNGIISGTPTTAGSFSPTFRVTDSVLATAQRVIAMSIINISPTITNVSVAKGEEGLVYLQSMDATGGTPPYVWTVLLGPLPPGLSISSDGDITGIPVAPFGDYDVRIKVTDNLGHGAQRDYTFSTYPEFSFPDAEIPQAALNHPFSMQFLTIGGAPPATFAGINNAPPAGMPAGLVLDVFGVVSGTPSESGTFTFTVVATDALAQNIPQEIILEVLDNAPFSEVNRELQLAFSVGKSRMRDRELT